MVAIAIFGATGMVGSAIAERAVERGHSVIGFSRKAQPAHPIHAVDYRVGDIADTQMVAHVATDVDVLVIAIPINRETGESESIIAAHRALIAARPQARVIVVGGAGGLELPDGTLLVDSPDFPADYEAEARAFVEILHLYRAATDLDWTIAAPSPEIAPGKDTQDYLLNKDQPAGDYVSTGTFAKAVLDEIDDPQYRRQRFTVADKVDG
ncbi:NAD-dependent epimerase/dehydratase family protein [Corynebacterium sp. sy017]|nr:MULTISPECIES: NAD(P)H-binding protein [unclassified Corynebacterium]MBP3088351.1 NAD-dependent epimerase/dehydratase family protein [Corynebacterium sp. sy017]TSD92081.1 NAD-dependent epimerase/dehydratase family protein [Corynebacterium sp. SY003]